MNKNFDCKPVCSKCHQCHDIGADCSLSASPAGSDESELKPLLYSVEERMMKRMYFALETARDNALECFNAHVTSIEGEPTVKEKHLTKLLLDDVNEATDLIKGLTDKYGKFENNA